MHKKIITKSDLLEFLAKRADINTLYIYSNKKWIYPKQGDDQRTCMMLDMNFNVEHKAGIVIHIPDKILENSNETL